MMMYYGKWAGNGNDPIFKVVSQQEERKLKSSADSTLSLRKHMSDTTLKNLQFQCVSMNCI
jgi:hypothetical protein